MKNRINISTIVCGLLVIAAGVLLFLFNTGALPAEYKYIVFSWQSLVVALGFAFLFSRFKWFGGIVLMLVGGFFLLRKLDIERFQFITQNAWTLVLIVAGVFIICKAIWGRKFGRGRMEYCRGKYQGKAIRDEGRPSRGWDKMRSHYRSRRDNQEWQIPEDETGYIERSYVFGGSKEKLEVNGFKGGSISCVFGGMELDLTGSQLAEGVNILELDAVFGGIVIYAPVDWKIEIRQSQVLGNFADNRPKPDFETDENRKLIIKVSSVLGGGEVKSRK